MKMIPYSRQHISKEDIKSVQKVLKSNFLTTGPQISMFEKKVAKFVNSKYATAVNSATSALHISCMALKLKKGDILWTVPNSFIASANCGLYCGAKIDFVDIDDKTLNISTEALEKKLLKSKKIGRLPKILVVVHFAGLSCEMDKIKKLSNRYKFKIIEDASHSLGGYFKNFPVGSCKFSDITVFSFHPVKIITTAEGGMAVTNNKNLAEKMYNLRNHGIERDPRLMNKKNAEPWYYEQKDLGYNYRISDVQAALGINQLKRINSFIRKRNQIAKKYIKIFNELSLQTQFVPDYIKSTYHLFVIRVEARNKLRIFNKLRKNGFYVNTHYIPIHLQPYYKNMGFKSGLFPVSENYYKQAISLPIYFGLSNKNQKLISNIVVNESK